MKRNLCNTKDNRFWAKVKSFSNEAFRELSAYLFRLDTEDGEKEIGGDKQGVFSSSWCVTWW